MECKRCQSQQVVKDGKNGSGSQRYLCRACARHFMPEPNVIGYDDAIKQAAVKDYLDDGNFRRIGDDAPRPVIDDDAVVEHDELFTFIGDKKTRSTSSRKFIEKRGAS